jgi:hypothetical protein
VTFQKSAPDRWANVKLMLIGETKPAAPIVWLPVLLAAAAVAAVPPRFAWIARIALGVALLVLTYWLYDHATGRTLKGMFALTPIAAYGLLASAWNPRWRPLWIFAVATTISIVALNRSNDAGGLQLGARLVLPALPALLILASAAIEDDARARGRRLAALVAPAALLVLTAVMFQRAFPAAYDIARKGELAATAAAAAPGRVVIARRWWESQIATPVLLDGKQILFTPARDLRPLFESLHAAGVTSAVLFAKGPVHILLSDGALVRDASEPVKAWLEVHDIVIDP